MATSATPIAGAAESPEAAPAQSGSASGAAWNPFFATSRPVQAIDPRRVIVQFDDPSLGEWSSAGARDMTAAQQRAWVKRALVLQKSRLDALSLNGVQFRVEHRYVRVMNGASLFVYGDGAQALRALPHVSQVIPVRTIWPAAIESSTPAGDIDEGAAGAAAAAGSPTASAPAGATAVHVAVLDTGIEASHPAVAGRVAATALDATARIGASEQATIDPEPHGTAVAGAVLAGAGADTEVRILPVQILSRRPARDGAEAVTGDSDDLIAGIELAVDPNGDGDTVDSVDVAVIASSSPYASFTGSPEAAAVEGADLLGTVIVAAAGNDGAGDGSGGTIGSVASSEQALAIGAVDLRDRVPVADLRVRGEGIDQTFSDASVLTAAPDRSLPAGKFNVVAIEGHGDDVVDYLDGDLRSRVDGAVAVVATRVGVLVADQVRAAADAGAVALVVGSDHADVAAGTIDVAGADVPAIALDRADARALRDALAGGAKLRMELSASTARNASFGTVAGFSSGGPRLDGVARPDAVAPGVGMLTAGARGSWQVSSGTSIAAAWAAGQAAAVRAARPSWSTASVRAALIGSALPLGSRGDRPALEQQGAGVLDARRAIASTSVVESGRIDLGSIAPGGTAGRRLTFTLPETGAAAPLPGDATILLDDGGRGAGISPSLEGDSVVLSVGADATPGFVGGWLVVPSRDLRVPWSAMIRDASSSTIALEADVTNPVLGRVAGPGAYASMLQLGIGGEARGIGAAQRVEIRILDASGKDHGAIGRLDHALPGRYSFGLTGVGTDGARLGTGVWTVAVRYVPASDPAGAWRAGPKVQVTVPRANG